MFFSTRRVFFFLLANDRSRLLCVCWFFLQFIIGRIMQGEEENSFGWLEQRRTLLPQLEAAVNAFFGAETKQLE